MPPLRAIRGGKMGADEYRVLNVPRAAVYRSTVQGINSGVNTSIIWDTLDYDTDGMWSSTASPERFTARTPGVYLFSATIGVSSGSATGYRYSYFTKNATILYYGQTLVYDRDAVSINWNHSAQIALNAGDYVTVDMVHNAGVLLNTATSSATSRQMSMQACLLSTL